MCLRVCIQQSIVNYWTLALVTLVLAITFMLASGLNQLYKPLNADIHIDLSDVIHNLEKDAICVTLGDHRSDDDDDVPFVDVDYTLTPQQGGGVTNTAGCVFEVLAFLFTRRLRSSKLDPR